MATNLTTLSTSNTSILDPYVGDGLLKADADAAKTELSAVVDRSHYAQIELQNPWVVVKQTKLG
jgi:hypothetical protein